MIIPLDHAHFKSLPPHWIIDPLMKHLNQEYYIALLSAASLYGATYQHPMTFQVIINKANTNIQLERGGVEFHVYKRCSEGILFIVLFWIHQRLLCHQLSLA